MPLSTVAVPALQTASTKKCWYLQSSSITPLAREPYEKLYARLGTYETQHRRPPCSSTAPPRARSQSLTPYDKLSPPTAATPSRATQRAGTATPNARLPVPPRPFSPDPCALGVFYQPCACHPSPQARRRGVSGLVRGRMASTQTIAASASGPCTNKQLRSAASGVRNDRDTIRAKPSSSSRRTTRLPSIPVPPTTRPVSELTSTHEVSLGSARDNAPSP